jgi:hypothetical protein
VSVELPRIINYDARDEPGFCERVTRLAFLALGGLCQHGEHSVIDNEDVAMIRDLVHAAWIASPRAAEATEPAVPPPADELPEGVTPLRPRRGGAS